MEKNVVLAIALSVGLFLAYITFFAPKPTPPGAAPPTTNAPTAPTDPAPAGRKPLEAGADVEAQRLPLPKERASGVEWTVAAKGGVTAADVWGCLQHDRRKVLAGEEERVPGDPAGTTDFVAGLPGMLSVDLVTKNPDVRDLHASAWKLTPAPDGVERSIETAGLRFTTTLVPSTDRDAPFHAAYVVSVRNVEATTKTATLEVMGPSPAPPAKGARPTVDDGVLIATGGENGEIEFLPASKIQSELAEKPGLERTTQGKWLYVAARSNFFLGALIPKGDLPAGTTVGFHAAQRPDPTGKPGTVPTAAASFRIPFEVPAKGEEKRFEFMVYAGPNWRALVHDEASPYHVLDGAARQSGFLGLKLTWIAQFLAWLLKGLMGAGLNAGLAVITLTMLVRGAMFPLSRSSQISMRLYGQKMQRLKPKMDAIKEKHKDPKKQQEATMKLMREEKVSPLPKGCLLAFVQMPIWIALYNVLQTTFEMRHASFLWVKDLTEPDHLVHLGEGMWLLPEWLNLLPLLMMATWVGSSFMQPLPADPQQAQTAKMMRWMPILMGVFLYSYPAGLALYMTMSALWSIGETWLIRKVWLAKMEKALT